MNFQQNWLKVLECVETLINEYIWLFATSFQLFCEIKCDIFEKKSINNHFKQPWVCSMIFFLFDSNTWVVPKEFKRVNWVFFDSCVNAMGNTTILTVMYWGELLYLQIWCDHLVWSVHIIVAAPFTVR